MGIDAHIYLRVENPEVPLELEFPLPNDYQMRPVDNELDEDAPLRATHRITNMDRFYGEGYERGPWPYICAVLMLLYASPRVETIWYGGDDRMMGVTEFSTTKLSSLTAHFMEFGCRPYHDRFK